jgi:hypothetical protein
MAAVTTERDNKVLAWDLQPATSVTESALLVIGPSAVSGAETAFSNDARTIVPPESIRKGGKYYCESVNPYQVLPLRRLKRPSYREASDRI